MHSVLQRAGSVVVRDVVRDALASAWAAELLAARAQRSHATFHHEAQVAARADASVLSATSQVAAALTGSRDNYVRIDAASPAPAPSTWTGKSLWEVSESAGASPLRAHLALAPTALGVPTASAAATYALLRPHFAARASRISFYSSADYLAEGNWVLRERGADYDAAHVHVRPARVNLAPGDVLVSHAGLNLASDAGAEAGLVLPVHPLPATKANKAFVARQRAAFEAGLPPPHVAVDGLVALEPAGDAAAIDTYVGRRAMGYDA
jgi:hypothetical protein